MVSFRFAMKQLRKYWGRTVLALICSLIGAIGFVVASLLLTELLNSLIEGSFDRFWVISLLDILSWLVVVGAGYFGELLSESAVQSAIEDIRLDILNQISTLNYESFHNKQSLNYSTALLTDLKVVEERTLQKFFGLADSIMMLIASSAALVYLHYSLLLTVIVLLIIMMVIPNFFSEQMSQAAENVATSEEEMASQAGHWIGGFDTLNDFNKKSLIVNNVRQFVESVKTNKIKDTKIQAIVGAVMGVMSTLSQLSTVFVSGYLSLLNIVPIGSVLSTGNLAGMVFQQVQSLSTQVAQFRSSEKVVDKLQQSSLAIEGQPTNETKDTSIGEDGRFTLATNGLSYTFPGGNVLHYPDMTLAGDKNIAIAGDSGVGKSVFFNILTRDYQNYSGSIQLNGVELLNIPEREIKDIIGHVRQKTYIFNKSLKDNITLCDDTISAERLQRAIDKSGLRGLVNRLSAKEDTIIGEKAIKLSGGQEQRISIARALIHDYPIILFDEVTANLDRTTAQAIEQEISHIDNGLKISVSHHLNAENETLYDEVIMFDRSNT